jgi:uncharacterized protein (TIGR02677 family)
MAEQSKPSDRKSEPGTSCGQTSDSVCTDAEPAGPFRLSSRSDYNVFAHLTAEKSEIYRAVLKVFVEAKARFVIHLRPADVESQLADRSARHAEATAIEGVLQQLVAWGNLEAHPDTAEVSTVEDFWRVRNLYQMSPAGEAAEAALSVFEQLLKQPGELQAAALDDIRHQLKQVISLSYREQVDDGEVFNTFSLLRQRFEELTAQAQRFIGGLQRRMELQGLNVESFLSYKQRLIDYLERFLSHLVLAAHEIAMTIHSIDQERTAPLLRRVAERELVDRLMPNDEDRATAEQAWLERWQGLCAWFVGSESRPSQAEELRSAARAAIPSLVAAVTGINDRRSGRSDRTADLRALARWFSEAEDDQAAHRLWRCAFALHSCRHLLIDGETLDQRAAEPVPSGTSWIDARPLRISPRLHLSGRYAPRGRPLKVIDRSLERAKLAQQVAQETQEILHWQQILATGQRLRLSELGELPDGAFQLLLDLLGEALAAKTGPDQAVSVTSSDGALCIDLEPTNDGNMAVIRTSSGVLIGEEHYLTVRPTLAERAESRGLPSSEPVPSLVAED